MTNVSYIGNHKLPSNLILNGYRSNLNYITNSVNGLIIDGWQIKSSFNNAVISSNGNVDLVVATVETTLSPADFITLDWHIDKNEILKLTNQTIRIIIDISASSFINAMVVVSNSDYSRCYQKLIEINGGSVLTKYIIDMPFDTIPWNGDILLTLVLRSPYVSVWVDEASIIPLNVTTPAIDSNYAGTGIIYAIARSDGNVLSGIWKWNNGWSFITDLTSIGITKTFPLVGNNDDLYLLHYSNTGTDLYLIQTALIPISMSQIIVGTIVDKNIGNGRVIHNPLDDCTYIFGSSTLWETYKFDPTTVALTKITTTGPVLAADDYGIAIDNNIVYFYLQNQLFQYDITTKIYTNIPMNNNGPITPRGPGMIVVNNKLLVYGGKDTATVAGTSAFSIYDLTTNLWTIGNSVSSARNRVSPIMFNQNSKTYVSGGGLDTTFSISDADIDKYANHSIWKTTTVNSQEYIKLFGTSNFDFYKGLNTITIDSVGLYENQLRDKNNIDLTNVTKSKELSRKITGIANDFIVAQGHASSSTQLQLYGDIEKTMRPGIAKFIGNSIGSGFPQGIDIVDSAGSIIPINSNATINPILQDNNSFGIDIIDTGFITNNPYYMIVKAQTSSIIKIDANA